MGFSLPTMPPLGNHICRVLFQGAERQMFDVAAGPVVARMHNNHSFGDRAVVGLPLSTVNGLRYAVDLLPHIAISTWPIGVDDTFSHLGLPMMIASPIRSPFFSDKVFQSVVDGVSGCTVFGDVV